MTVTMERAVQKLRNAPSCAQKRSRSLAEGVKKSCHTVFEKALFRELDRQSLAAVSAKKGMAEACAGEEEKMSGKKTSRWSGFLPSTMSPLGLLWREIICPPRLEYSWEDLGPSRLKLGPYAVEREDLTLRNSRGHSLECSHFRRVGAPAKCPCVVYVHGHGSSRLEVFSVLDALIARDISVFSFDLSGSGQSGGDYVSLGHYEEQDVRAVLQHLRSSGENGPVGIWGRSMGASAAVLRAAADDELAACVLDSPFSSFPAVAKELVQNLRLKIPDFLIDFTLRKLRGEIRSRAKFDIEDLKPIQHAPLAKSPVLFVVAKDDDFVLPHHTYRLHGAWGGDDKTLVTVGGAHNSLRPPKFLAYAADFLAERFMQQCTAPTPKAPPTEGKPAAFFAEAPPPQTA